jgi:hypothetical protein
MGSATPARANVLTEVALERPDQRTPARTLFTVRQALPITNRWGIEFLGALSQAAGRWVYAAESIAMVRLTR